MWGLRLIRTLNLGSCETVVYQSHAGFWHLTPACSRVEVYGRPAGNARASGRGLRCTAWHLGVGHKCTHTCSQKCRRMYATDARARAPECRVSSVRMDLNDRLMRHMGKNDRKCNYHQTRTPCTPLSTGQQSLQGPL